MLQEIRRFSFTRISHYRLRIAHPFSNLYLNEHLEEAFPFPARVRLKQEVPKSSASTFEDFFNGKIMRKRYIHLRAAVYDINLACGIELSDPVRRLAHKTNFYAG